jgi:hypothetical protein
MARATTRTLLSLDRFAQLLGMNPLHFNQIVVDGMQVCDTVVTQYSWQANGAASREDFAFAIDQAERRLASVLGFDVAPRWNEHSYIQAKHGDLFKTPLGYMLEAGKEAVSLITATTGITYTDEDGDGYFETATCAVTTTVTDPNEIALIYPGNDGNLTWEIRPIKVTINGGIATIRCRREQLVNPALQESIDGEEVDGLDDGNFLAVVDVYRHYNDHTDQGTFTWVQNSSFSRCGCVGGSECLSCGETSQAVCVKPLSKRHGMFYATPANYDVDTDSYKPTAWGRWWNPDYMKINYRAGYGGPTMDPLWENVVAHYALALLPMQPCDCLTITTKYEQYNRDMALSNATSTESNSYNVGNLTQNPLGSRVGAIEAWQVAQDYALGRKAYHG